ncbi:MAG: enoyl-CoA hydratase/isomerase family protein [Polymorphobacter sp.]
MSELVAFSIHDGIATVTFTNPPRGYMNAPQVAAANAVVDTLEALDGVRAVIFTGGVPGVFIRHYDVGELVAIAQRLRGSGIDDGALAEQARGGNAVSVLFDKVAALPMPTIAAIDGFAQGGGFEFALCCDFRIAGRGDYRIGLPETNIGIFPGAGGIERLTRLIGAARATEMVLRGQTVGPEAALALGMVNALASGSALAAATDLARELAAKSPQALADAKALLRGAETLSLADGMAETRARFLLLLKHDAAALAAMQAFLATGEDINR